MEEKLALYDRIIERCADFKRAGKSMPHTAANGYMFTLLNKAGEIGIRLSKEEQKAFVEKHGGGPYMSYGAVMRDYVIIPEDMHGEEQLMADYFKASYDFVMSLPHRDPKKRK